MKYINLPEFHLFVIIHFWTYIERTSNKLYDMATSVQQGQTCMLGAWIARYIMTRLSINLKGFLACIQAEYTGVGV